MTASIVSQSALLALASPTPVSRISQTALLVLAAQPVVSRRKAWAFDFDGHSFYVLDLGNSGTFLFDLTTGAWCQFITQGYSLWNMRYGGTWGQSVVACDSGQPFVWVLDPDVTLDQGTLPILHAVTALLPFRNRKGRRHDALRLSASTANLGQSSGATVSLRFSDDGGNTWSKFFTLTLTNKSDQELAWRSLGRISAPGRVLEITDSAGPLSLIGLDAEVEGVDTPPQPEQQAGDD